MEIIQDYQVFSIRFHALLVCMRYGIVRGSVIVNPKALIWQNHSAKTLKRIGTTVIKILKGSSKYIEQRQPKRDAVLVL